MIFCLCCLPATVAKEKASEMFGGGGKDQDNGGGWSRSFHPNWFSLLFPDWDGVGCRSMPFLLGIYFIIVYYIILLYILYYSLLYNRIILYDIT